MLRHLLFALALSAAAFSQADIYYTAKPDPESRSLQVSVTFDNPSDQPVFHIPAWAPGFYYLLNFQNKISNVHADGMNGTSLSVRQDGGRWLIDNPSKGPVTVTYRVQGDDAGLGFFRVHTGASDCFVNGASAFMYLEGRMTEPYHLKVSLPENWKVATPMDPEGDGFVASTGYDEFIDHPLQMGRFERRDFNVEGIPFSAVFVSPERISANLDDSAERLRICSIPAIKLFGKAPFKRYMYIVHLSVGDFGGGLEHRASNVIAVPNSGTIHLDELGTHEYFHAWNVKQIRPKVLGPFDYTKRAITGNLWFSEGVTDYYAYITAHRAKIEADSWLLLSLTRQIQELQGGSTRMNMTVENCSREAWQNGFGTVGDLSYYNKGLVAGLIFDSAIRAQTNGAKSLDDVMRLLFERYRLPNPGFDEDALRSTISEVAGTDLGSLYDLLIRSTREVPYESLKRIGLRVRMPGTQELDYGFDTSDGFVTNMSSQTEDAGLQNNDKIVAIDGRPFTQAGNLAGRKIRFVATVLRNGHQITVKLPIVKTSAPQFTLEADPFATQEATDRFQEWIKR